MVEPLAMTGLSRVATEALTLATAGDVGAFAGFLSGSPIPAILLLAGALVTGVTVVVLAYLSVGAVLEALIVPASR